MFTSRRGHDGHSNYTTHALVLFSVCFVVAANLHSHNTRLLLAVLKATINLMHKLAPVIIRGMLSKEPKVPAHELTILSWPDGLGERNTREKSEWTQKQLSELEITCESLFTEGIGLFVCLFAIYEVCTYTSTCMYM